MIPGVKVFDRFNRLGVRLVFLLGLALLPVGLIAMLQTYRVIDDANGRIDSSLLGESMAVSAANRRMISRNTGIAEVLASVIPQLLETPEKCNEQMLRTVTDTPQIIFAGFINAQGILECASRDVGRALTTSEEMAEILATPRLNITVSPRTAVTQTPAILINYPVFEDARAIGRLIVTLPYSLIDHSVENAKNKPLDILTFDAKGTLLTSDMGMESAAKRLPVNRALVNLASDDGIVFDDVDPQGRERIYSVVPLVPGQIFALSIWSRDTWRVGLRGYATALAFPFLMWVISLTVAYVAVHRLVIRHIRTLRRNIRTFGAVRRVRTPTNLAEIPVELRDVTQAFTNLTEKVLRDEADQENLLHEKDVLLKEVHHRVKNNLQLISSITNMQIRRARHGETKFMLRRLQDRVMGLATVHRSLYQASVLSQVRADELVSELSKQLARSAAIPELTVDFTIDTDKVFLYPDQAVPLSLLVTEAVTNAYKYIGRPTTGKPWVALSLKSMEGGQVELLVRNSTGTPVVNQDEDEVSGLGSQLIGAFVMQLGGTHQAGPSDDGAYEVKVVFSPADFTIDSDT
ncbi:sensor histidine kinase [Oceaniglobus ichthyenteri]|uniref:sensor histidine kinase n=1 Tax=Oceaniglobus ichthyenteri TaxID=2136177 RepID=UPI000D356844|nr:sensor histidine kinase [Oceaniglobus ichthyenteri]